MSEQTEKKARAKIEGPRNYVVTDTDGKDWIVKCANVRVANNDDKDNALEGKLPRAKLEAA